MHAIHRHHPRQHKKILGRRIRCTGTCAPSMVRSRLRHVIAAHCGSGSPFDAYNIGGGGGRGCGSGGGSGTDAFVEG